MPPLPQDQFLRDLWLRIYHQYGMSAQSVTVRFAAGKLKLSLPEMTLATPPEANTGDVASQILAVLAEADRPLKGQAIASRAGRKFNSHFKQTLAQLKRDGEVVLVADGYTLPPDQDLTDT
jgi:hypothetical protein